MRRSLAPYALAVALGPFLSASYAGGAEPRIVSQNGVDLQVHDVKAQGDAVTARVTNPTDREARDVRLLVQRVYRWPNEFHPTANSPSAATVEPLGMSVPPGSTVQFRGSLPGSSAKGGSFETRVEVLGYELVGNPRSASR
jgi:hypothetical protein